MWYIVVSSGPLGTFQKVCGEGQKVVFGGRKGASDWSGLSYIFPLNLECWTINALCQAALLVSLSFSNSIWSIIFPPWLASLSDLHSPLLSGPASPFPMFSCSCVFTSSSTSSCSASLGLPGKACKGMACWWPCWWLPALDHITAHSSCSPVMLWLFLGSHGAPGLARSSLARKTKAPGWVSYMNSFNSFCLDPSGVGLDGLGFTRHSGDYPDSHQCVLLKREGENGEGNYISCFGFPPWEKTGV